MRGPLRVSGSRAGAVPSDRAVFILRLERDALGRVTGVVERVRTGEKARVETLADVGPVLAAMLARETESGSDR
jgi:hypothetical protein